MGHRGPVLVVLCCQSPRSRGHRATFQTVSKSSSRKLRGDRSLDRQGRSGKLHSVRTKRPPEYLAVRSAAQRREFIEERLYLTRGLQGSDQSSGPLPDIGPDVRYLSRREDRISGPHLVALLADLDYVFTLDNVEPLVLLVVQVPRRPALVESGYLGNGEAAVRVEGRNLDVDSCSCVVDVALPPKSISPSRYVSCRYLRAFP